MDGGVVGVVVLDMLARGGGVCGDGVWELFWFGMKLRLNLERGFGLDVFYSCMAYNTAHVWRCLIYGGRFKKTSRLLGDFGVPSLISTLGRK